MSYLHIIVLNAPFNSNMSKKYHRIPAKEAIDRLKADLRGRTNTGPLPLQPLNSHPLTLLP